MRDVLRWIGTVLVIILVVGVLFGIKDQIVFQQREKESQQLAYDRVFNTELPHVKSLYDEVGSALDADDFRSACIEVSKISSVTGEICFNSYCFNYPLVVVNTEGSGVYYRTFYRDITYLLANGCSRDQLRYVHVLLGEILDLYEKNSVISDRVPITTSVCNFYHDLMELHKEMESIRDATTDITIP